MMTRESLKIYRNGDRMRKAKRRETKSGCCKRKERKFEKR
jgi:hypothetical protein